MSHPRTRQAGLSVIELMVGLTVGLLVILAALALYASVAAGARDTLGSARLTSELRAAMDVMTGDIMRAGFGGVDFSEPDVSDLAVYEDGNCIVYSYDANLDGVLKNSDCSSPGGSCELYGFKIEGGELKIRDGDGDLANCDPGNGTWSAVTSGAIVEIEALENNDSYFELEHQCISSKAPDVSAGIDEGQRCISGNDVYQQAVTKANANDAPVVLIETRKVKLHLRGHLANDEAMTVDLRDEVLVRNHRVVVVEPSS